MHVLRLRPERLEWRRVDGEVIAVDLESSTYLSANETAVPLWEALARGTTREALIENLTGAAGIGRDEAAGDVDDFLGALAERRLLLDETATA